MKCFILGLDAIEYDFVEAWNTRNLMQTEYGKIEVPLGEDGIPHSPQVWASFLTGNIENLDFKRGSGIYGIIYACRKFYKKYIDLPLGIIKRFRKRSLEMRGPLTFDSKLPNPTFLDTINSKAINAPYVNHDNSCFILSHKFSIGELSLEETLELLKSDYHEHKQLILKEVESLTDVDVVFAFINHIDHFQHKAMYRQEIVEEIYSDIDNYVGVLKEKLTIKYPNSYIIIVSDHGFDFNTGKHSKHAFYSTNIPLDPAPKKITDFYKIVTSLAS
jgi:predicted AlkP superfamily phosphohydrolase/phosphomutase